MTLAALIDVAGVAVLVWLPGALLVAFLDRVITEQRPDWLFAALWPLWLIGIVALCCLAPFVPDGDGTP